MTLTSLSVPSFAKINWTLHILGKRPDSYHEVETTLQTISLHDSLKFELAETDVTLSCSEPDIPTDDRNLIVRAANALKDRYGVRKGARIQLEKRIPAQAGLGGASSNAAVSLLALAQLWKLKPGESALAEMAAGLGADVPFFLWGGCALATGIGTTISPLPECGIRHLVIVMPKAKVSTRDAYAALNSSALTTMYTAPILSSLPGGTIAEESAPGCRDDDLSNDFESVIFEIEPEIRRTKETLLQAGARVALLAGSGSSVFGIFAAREAQQRALDVIKLEVGWRCYPCVTLSRNEYVSALSSSGVPLLRSSNSGIDIGA